MKKHLVLFILVNLGSLFCMMEDPIILQNNILTKIKPLQEEKLKDLAEEIGFGQGFGYK